MRRKYLVDRKSQLRLVLLIIILVIGATSVSATVTLILVNREIGSTFYLAHRDTWDLKELLLPVVIGTSMIAFLLVSVISIVIALRESHRIVGPTKRLTRVIKDLSEGRISFGVYQDTVRRMNAELEIIDKNIEEQIRISNFSSDSIKNYVKLQKPSRIRFVAEKV